MTLKVTYYLAVLLGSIHVLAQLNDSVVTNGAVYPEQTGFVRVYNGRFVTDDCKEFFFTGFNGWELIEIAIGYPGALPDDLSFLGDQNLIDYILDTAMASGLNVIRIFGHGTTSAVSTQRYCCAGEYKEEVLQGLDHILDSMAQRDLKIILTFGDNWRPDFPDTVQYYVNQSSTAVERDDFWFDEEAKQMYKNHINFMVNRINTFNGRAYKDDPTIFSWNIINEPRCHRPECVEGTALADWIDEMAAYIKSVDPNHMLTVGEEGFYKFGCYHVYNPADWATTGGQDSPLDHSSQYIDYVSSHVWMDNWGRGDVDFLRTWISGKVLEANTLGKPLVLQEFGKKTESQTDAAEIASVRDPVYQLVYGLVEESLANGGPFRGALFWTWNYGHDHEQFFGQGVGIQDSTWDIIEAHSSLMTLQRLQLEPLEGCIPGRGPTTDLQYQVDTSTLLFSDFENCCEDDCNSVFGEVYGIQSLETVQTSSADECCSLCKTYDECEGYSWCGCSAGCGAYGFQDCIMKNLPFPFFPMNQFTGDSVKFVSGVPGVEINQDVGCQIGAPCNQQLDSCTGAEFQASIACADATCNAEWSNMKGDVLYTDYEIDMGVPVNSIADCCAACQQEPACTAWSYCTQFDCGNRRGNSCMLKTPTEYGYWEAGQRQPWVSGYVPKAK